MPQLFSMFEETVALHTPIEFESNMDHPIIEDAILRYETLIFDHKTNHSNNIPLKKWVNIAYCRC